MKSYLILITFFFISCSPEKPEAVIKTILNGQVDSWNKGDLEEFMSGYWKSDSLIFIGNSGITYGWNKTLSNYKKAYPDKATMGVLSFHYISVEKIDKANYFVVGKWALKREKGNISGHYTLLFRKISGEWKIIADHSS
jgi:hypothetical protein